jgi:hypothetical protein
VSTPDPADLRISDADRNAAVDALSQHLAAGRIDLNEFDTRSTSVANARTASDLTGLFDDLPGPHPQLSTTPLQRQQLATPLPAGAPVPPPAPGSDIAYPDQRSRAQKIVAGITAVSGVVAVALFFILSAAHVPGAWLAFLLIPAVGGIARGVWGNDWNQPRRG